MSLFFPRGLVSCFLKWFIAGFVFTLVDLSFGCVEGGSVEGGSGLGRYHSHHARVYCIVSWFCGYVRVYVRVCVCARVCARVCESV